MLDISDLPGGKPNQPTPRKKLTEIIQALVDLEPKPRAIAVDVDFSPLSNTFVTPDDPDFFDFCLEASNKRKVPIFLAVGKRKSAPPDAWLGEIEYKQLAVAVAANKQDTSKIPLWVRAKGAKEELKTMSYALALVYRRSLPDAPTWIDWAVNKNVEESHETPDHQEILPDDSVLEYAARLVNYSKLDSMKNAAKKDTSAESVKNTGNAYSNKIVILGDVSTPLDFFPVPGRQQNEGGSLLHACSTYTLIKEPLFEFKPKVLLFLDLGIALFIIAMVALIRYRDSDNLSWRGRQAIFIYLAIVVVVVAGLLLVPLAGVMWVDFLFVAFALVLHPKLEHRIHQILKKLAKSTRSPHPPDSPAAAVKAAVLVGSALLTWTLTARAQECPQGADFLAFRLSGKRGN
jgi:hypothetical protein